jgi:hypothetical protein
VKTWDHYRHGAHARLARSPDSLGDPSEPQLQTGQVAQIQKNGRTCYIVADPPQNVVYVGGPTEYQAYQQMRAQRQLAQENLQTAEMYQDAAMDWGSWGGWGVGWGRMGYGIGVGRVR